jgi:parallel beta-helix repeat protein
MALPTYGAAINGTVFDDQRALANRADFAPLSGVSVHAYRDGGDLNADGKDDTAAGDAVTGANGAYSINVPSAGVYWIVVDSHSIKPSSVNGNDIPWAEQTFGPAGSLCDTGNGIARSQAVIGPCYGGRSATRGDDARSLSTAKHVAGIRVAANDATMSGTDFAFSFDVVTNVADGDNIQGSFRQFLVNANAIGGANTMRFVPVSPLPEPQPREQRHWTIHLTKPLPPIRDDGTAINGTAYHFTTATPLALSRQEIDARDEAGSLAPEIDVVVELTGDDGIVFDRRGSIRSIGLDGAKTAVRANAEVTIERAVIEGNAPIPDETRSAAAATAAPTTIDGIVATHGVLVTNNTIVRARSRYGIVIEGDATLDATQTEVMACGSTTAGGAVVLRTSGSTLSRCAIHRNGGVGIEIDAPSNTIDSNRITDNWIGIVLHPRGASTTIARNELVWNRSGAIVASEANAGPAKHNRITRNHFNENGGETIAVGAIVEDETKRRTPSCNPDANGTIDAPYIESASKSGPSDNATIDVEGIACPGASVEVYTSFVTGRLRERLTQNKQDLYSVREALKNRSVVETRDYHGLNLQRLPSVGEFNYAGVAIADANGRFRITIPWPQQSSLTVTSMQVTGGLGVAAVTIDAAGDTSPFSGRRLVGGTR